MAAENGWPFEQCQCEIVLNNQGPESYQCFACGRSWEIISCSSVSCRKVFDSRFAYLCSECGTYHCPYCGDCYPTCSCEGALVCLEAQAALLDYDPLSALSVLFHEGGFHLEQEVPRNV